MWPGLLLWQRNDGLRGGRAAPRETDRLPTRSIRKSNNRPLSDHNNMDRRRPLTQPATWRSPRRSRSIRLATVRCRGGRCTPRAVVMDGWRALRGEGEGVRREQHKARGGGVEATGTGRLLSTTATTPPPTHTHTHILTPTKPKQRQHRNKTTTQQNDGGQRSTTATRCSGRTRARPGWRRRCARSASSRRARCSRCAPAAATAAPRAHSVLLAAASIRPLQTS